MNIYRSEHGTVFLDPRGFVEFVIAKHSMFTSEEDSIIASAIAAQGIAEIPLLISRINEYAVPESFNILDLSKVGAVTISKVAVYAPSPGDRTFAKLMEMTAFKNVPYKIFDERDTAIDWLLNPA